MVCTGASGHRHAKGASQEMGRRLCAHGRADHWPLPSPASKPRAQPAARLCFSQDEQRKKKGRERPVAWDGGTRRGSRTILAELSVRRLAQSGVSMRAGWPSLFRSPGFSLPLSPALDSQPRGLRQWPVRCGERGVAVLEKTPAVSLLWRACPGTGGSPEF